MSSRAHSSRQISDIHHAKKPVHELPDEIQDGSDDVFNHSTPNHPTKKSSLPSKTNLGSKQQAKKKTTESDNDNEIPSDNDDAHGSLNVKNKDRNFVGPVMTSRITSKDKSNEIVRGVTTRGALIRENKRHRSISDDLDENRDESRNNKNIKKKIKSEDTNNEMKDVEQQPMTPQRKNSTMSKGKDVDRHSTISEDIDWPNSDEDDEDILQAKKMSKKQYIKEQTIQAGVRPMPTKADLGIKPTQGHLEDYESFNVTDLPNTCEVFFPEMQDKRLRRTYKDLPPLKLGGLRSWTSNKKLMHHYVEYSAWEASCPKMNLEKKGLLFRAITFQSFKHFINPSRVDPTYVRMHCQSGNSRGHLYVGKKIAMCLTVGFVTESSLIDVPEDKKVRQKQILLILHTQEGERFGAFACMVFNADDDGLTAQFADKGLSFSTMSESSGTLQSASNMLSPIKSPLASRLAAKEIETKKKSSSNLKTSYIKTALDFDDEVPIFDGREHDFNFDDDLQNISDLLPLYESEVPFGSCALVAHTMTSYKKEEKNHLSLNVQWVVILGTTE